jgi:general secretion pathway protein G
VLKRHGQRGFSLIEVVVAIAIMGVLATAALPLARLQVRREKERELRNDLYRMRDAIDRYKQAADRGMFQIKVGSDGYPPDLESLVSGVDIGNNKKVRFLRKVPVDPMTGRAEWGMRSTQDDPDSDSFGGQNVFDVYSLSQDTAMDGTKYKDW